MNYIGNYKDWITEELMEYLRTHDGDTRPVWQPERWQGHPILDSLRETCRVAYSHRDDKFQQFNARTEGVLPITLPTLPEQRQHYPSACICWYQIAPRSSHLGNLEVFHILFLHLIELFLISFLYAHLDF